jgi:MFS family permease
VGAVSRLAGSLRAFAEVFANPGVRNVQLADVGSTLGTWAYGVALPVYAYHAGGARAVGILFFARFALAAVAAPWLGLLADRWSRRQLMLTADLVRLAIFAAMTAVAEADGPVLAVYVLAVTSTIVSGSYQPAQAALLPSLVSSPEELTAANLVGNTVASLGMFAGPAVGGVLLALSGPPAVFALNGALFLWSAIFIVRVPRDLPPARPERTPFLPEFAAGFAAILRRPALRLVVGLTAGQTLVAGALEVLVVVLALRLLHAGNAGVGWLNTALGVGSLLGAAVVAAVAARKRLAGGFALGVLLWGLPIALAAAWANLGAALVLVGIVGVGSILIEVTGVTLMQRSAENEVLGRVFGALQSLALGALAVGSLAAPGLVSWLGPRWALVATGAFLPVLLVPLWPGLRRVDAAGAVAEEPLELLRGIPIFALLPEPVLERLAARAAEVSVAAGEAVFSRGDRGGRFYVVAVGRAAVDLEGEAGRELGPGGFFGEIALLRDVPRTATVRALEDLRLYAVAGNDFIAAVTGHAPSLEAAQSVIAERLPAGMALG